MTFFEVFTMCFLFCVFIVVMCILYIADKIFVNQAKKIEQDAEYIRRVVLKARPNAKLISNSHGHLRIEDGTETLTSWCATWMEAWTQAGNML